jgi:predicted dehydrogenase
MRITVVGTGSVGLRHLGNLAALGVEHLTAVSEHGRKDHVTVGGRNIPVLHDYGLALAGDCDAVFICNPTVLHLDYLRRAVAAGKHVYLEKPAALSAEGVAGLAAEAERRGLTVAVGHQFRFNPLLLALKERVGSLGLLLDVAAMQGEHLADYHPDEDYRLGYAARSELGGGVLLTQIHQIDYLNWIFGPFRSVYAVGGRRGPLEIDVEDTVSYLLERADGTPVHGHLDYLQRPKRVALSVAGAQGRLDWDYFAGTLAFTPARAGAEPELRHEPLDRNAMFLGIVGDFLEAVRDRRPPRSTLADAATDLVIVDAIKRSAAEHRAVLLI